VTRALSHLGAPRPGRRELGGLRRRIEIALLPDDVDVRLNLDRAARLARPAAARWCGPGQRCPAALDCAVSVRARTDRAAPASNLSSKFPPVGRRHHGGFKKSVATPAKTRYRPS
jgi:hypothetical protein